MAGWPPAKNDAFIWSFFIRDADGDPVAGATGLDVEFSIDGGVFADVAGVEVDEGEGNYSCPISAAEMNGDIIALICKTSTGGAKTAAQTIYTSTRQVDDLAFPSVSGRSFVVETDGMIHADVKEWLGTAPLALIAQRVDANAQVVGDKTGYTLTSADRALIINEVWDELISEARAALSYGQRLKDAVGLDTLTAARVANLDNPDVLTSSRAVAGDAMALTVAAINLIWDELTSEGRTGGSFGQLFKDNVDALISSRATPAQVNTEVSDVLKTDTIAELGVGIPAATPTFETAIMALYMLLRNKLDVDASFKEVHNDAGVIVFKKALTDDATTYSEAEAQSG